MDNSPNEDNHKLTHLRRRLNLDYQHARLIEFFLKHKAYSYKIIEAESNYYDLTLEQRMGVLGAHDLDTLCKTIILENTAFDEKYESEYYKRYYLTIVQYTSEFNAEKIFKILKNIQNTNCKDKLSNKYFHFRLAKNEVAFNMTGYRFNCITPFLMKADE